MASASHYYILLQDKPFESKSVLSTIGNLISKSAPGYALKGSLLIFAGRSTSSTGADVYHLANDPNKRIECVSHEVGYLREDEYEFLLPIKETRECFKLYNQKDKFKSTTTLAFKDRVWVSLPEEPRQGICQTSCCSGIVKYIGPIPENQGNYFGLELQAPVGTCDGTIRGVRFFSCEDLYGIYLPANHIISKSGTSQVPSVSVLVNPQKKEKKKGKLLVSSDKSSSGREFREGDRVTVFDSNDKQCVGTVKWALPGKENGLDGYIIGIELDDPVKKEKFPDNVPKMGSYFTKPNYKKHTYLAMPEAFVSKKSEIEKPEGWIDINEDYYKNEGIQPTKSVLLAISEVAKDEHTTVDALVNESEAARKKIEDNMHKQVLINAGVPPEELKGQESRMEHYEIEKKKQLERRHEEERNKKDYHQVSKAKGSKSDHLDNQPQFRNQNSYDELQNRDISGLGRQNSMEHKEPASGPYHPGEGASGPYHPGEGAGDPQSKAVLRQQTGYPPGTQDGFDSKNHLEIGSRVEVCTPDGVNYGTIRWIGTFPDVKQKIAGVELDDQIEGAGDGSWNGVEYFYCPKGHAMFVALDKLRPDERFSQKVHGDNPVDKAVGNKQRVVQSAPAPDAEKKVNKFIGTLKGIQGNQNSCYLDATLFGMFALNNYFDQMLLEEVQDEYGREVQDIISTKIIYPLRQNTVVSYDPVMELRRALDKLGKVKGITHAEQDPEEFLNLLFKHALRIKPFLRLHRRSGEDTEFFLQLFVEPSEKKIWTVKEMLTQSLKGQGISFIKPPLKLIIQLPRYGKDFKVFERIFPEIDLDISELCRGYAPLVPDDATCVICGEHSPNHSCSDCGSRDNPVFKQQEVMYFCEDCSKRVHHHEKRFNHRVKPLVYTPADNPVCKMQLMSVICIEKSHYVCFTRFEKRWFFFDSMADRTDTEFNIPEVTECPEIGRALDNIDETRKKDPSTLHPLVRRLVKDASICVYVDPEGDMYGEQDDSFNHGTDPSPGRGTDPAPGHGRDPAPGRGRDPAPAPGRGRDPAPAPGRGRDPAPAPGRGRDPAPDHGRDPAPAPGRGRDPAPGHGRDPAPAPGHGRDPAPGHGHDFLGSQV